MKNGEAKYLKKCLWIFLILLFMASKISAQGRRTQLKIYSAEVNPNIFYITIAILSISFLVILILYIIEKCKKKEEKIVEKKEEGISEIVKRAENKRRTIPLQPVRTQRKPFTLNNNINKITPFRRERKFYSRAMDIDSARKNLNNDDIGGENKKKRVGRGNVIVVDEEENGGGFTKRKRKKWGSKVKESKGRVEGKGRKKGRIKNRG